MAIWQPDDWPFSYDTFVSTPSSASTATSYVLTVYQPGPNAPESGYHVIGNANAEFGSLRTMTSQPAWWPTSSYAIPLSYITLVIELLLTALVLVAWIAGRAKAPMPRAP